MHADKNKKKQYDAVEPVPHGESALKSIVSGLTNSQCYAKVQALLVLVYLAVSWRFEIYLRNAPLDALQAMLADTILYRGWFIFLSSKVELFCLDTVSFYSL